MAVIVHDCLLLSSHDAVSFLSDWQLLLLILLFLSIIAMYCHSYWNTGRVGL